ncbi:FadR/GntR family transcriptional regulator [Clostridium sp. Marseille-P299]|uniref:FadR/GntR family transcriptional regulator n=1 Tax=Clostridium sp. Marseille-P299 TaxID=1805477 RepID=UPI000830C29A|nr:FadR/GntR family transcriptional regulator [Clostridium sp. Marseille-P299]
MLKSLYNNQKRLPELVAEQIKELIVQGELKAGEKLPNEFEMANQLQVGRGTIREAVKILCSQNIVEIRRGCGTFVCERTGIMDDPLGLWMIEDKKKLALDLCEVRLMIEPEIARLAAERATDEEILQLREAGAKVEECIRKGVGHSEADIAFHELLAELSKNQVVPNLIPVIQSAVMLFIKMTESVLKEETIRTHNAIVEAVANRDGAKAKESMQVHLLLNREEIKKVIGQ